MVHWNQNHFVVVHKMDKQYAWIADPGKGLIKLNRKEFEKKWISTRQKEQELGIALLLEPSVSFQDTEGSSKTNQLNAAHLSNILRSISVRLYNCLLAS